MCSAGMLPASVVVRKCRWNARPRAGETPALRSDMLVGVMDGFDERTNPLWVLFSATGLDTGGHVDAEGLKNSDGFGDIECGQASGDDDGKLDTDDLHHGARSFPVEGGTSSAEHSIGLRVKQESEYFFAGVLGNKDPAFLQRVARDRRNDFRDSDVLQRLARVLQQTLKRLPAMQLDGSQASLRNHVAYVVSIGIDEYADLFDVLRQVLDNIAHRSGFHLARTLVVKDEAEGVGPCVNRRASAFDIRESSVLVPSPLGSRQSSVVGKGKTSGSIE